MKSAPFHDTVIFYPCVEVMELVERVQADLTRLKRYFTANKLTIIADKTSYLVDKKGERTQIP
jgi:hypothetical protein